MKYQAISIRALSLLLTLSCVPLLLADSTGPSCGSFSFNRSFDITTTCGGDQSGRVTVSAMPSPVSGTKSSFTLSNVLLPVKKVDVGGGCEDDGDPFVVTRVYFTFSLSGATGGAGGSAGGGGNGGGNGGEEAVDDATCEVDLKTGLGKDHTCTARSGATCTAHVEAGP